jgi:hypothetical protein
MKVQKTTDLFLQIKIDIIFVFNQSNILKMYFVNRKNSGDAQ